MRRITVDVLDAAGSVLHTNVPARGVSYGAETSDAASCRLTIPADHPAAADLELPGNLVRFRANGTTDGTFVVMSTKKGILRPRGELRVLEVQGLDWVSLLSDAPITPGFGIQSLPAATEVRFDWTHPSLNRSSWGTPVGLGAVWGADLNWLDAPAAAYGGSGLGTAPTGHSDAAAWWIWDRALDGSYSHPVGTVYFHHDMVVETSVVAAFVWTADERAALAIDGVVIDPGVDAPSTQRTEARIAAVELTPGWHTLDIRAVNDAWLGASVPGSFNPGSLTLTAYKLPALSSLMTETTAWFRTGATNAGWFCLGYPANEPGFTVPHATRLLVERAQTDNHLPGLTLGFTDSTWTGGAAAPLTSELAARTQDSIFDTLRAWSSLGFCDFAFDVSARRLDLWPYQGRPGLTYSLDDQTLAAAVLERRR